MRERGVRLSGWSGAGLVTLCLVAAGGVSACGGAGGDRLAEGRIVIGMRYDQPGLALKGPGGRFTGFDIDVATYVADRLGVRPGGITWKEAVSAERENLLVRGDVDLVVATYTITLQRKQKVDFAGPYFLAHQDLLVRADDASVTSATDLNSRKLCSTTGSTSAQNVKRRLAPRADLQEFRTITECLTGLENREVDAMTNDDANLAGFTAQPQHRGKFRLVGLRLSDERYGIGIRKGRAELRRKVNEALARMTRDGSWRRSAERHFGPAGYRYEPPPPITETG
ncbi:glutamate transport system substrate-binding protein [Actinomadura namibiensis]|uniref:Glutamate transport system substrate-binding protein n=1 Tax=Actinomadura namibiensis TaxID=182080 RepID=A0A7W3QNB2_ACTNM|nr:glutamate ABC transporter substrate-binding protein [Actinomadura namibiensis]MBA8953455.1 glutamate transport system substrate-binding protein [Actinomadura namibiensis]